MKKYLFIVIFMAAIVYAAVQPLNIPSPGLTGMNSNLDVELVKITDSRYAENIDVSITPGAINSRKGIKSEGQTWNQVFGAGGFYDPVIFWKQALGAVPYAASDSIFVHRDRTSSGVDGWYAGDTTIWILPSDSTLGRVIVSDTFSPTLDTVIPYDTKLDLLGVNAQRIAFTPPNKYKSFERQEGFVVIATGYSTPWIYTALGGAQTRDSMYDTTAYKPRFIPLGIPAPGQLVPIVLGDSSSGGINYPVKYTYAYINTVATPSAYGDSTNQNAGDTAINSAIVFPKNKNVAITGFLHRPRTKSDSLIMADTTNATQGNQPQPCNIVLFAQRVSRSGDQEYRWRIVEQFYMDHNEYPIIIDSGVGNYLSDGFVPFDYIPAPGGMQLADTITTEDTLNDFTLGQHPDSSYYLAWSWYDPQLQIESPLGPKIFSPTTSGVGVDTFSNVFSLGYISEKRAPTRWIRVYQTLQNDTSTWYCVMQVKIDINQDSSSVMGNQIILGWMPEDSVATGADIEDMGIDTIVGYTNANWVVGDPDGALIRPPLEDNLDIPFTEVRFSNGRYWGIGDPLFPDRLYYSGFDAVANWNANNYLSLPENDEIVRIVPSTISGSEVLYVLGHNGISVVSGYDAEYDLSITKIETEDGVLDEFSLIEANSIVYYLSPKIRIHSLSGGQPKDISIPIENYLDTLFGNKQQAKDSVRTYRLSEKLCWYSLRESKSICYDLRLGTWSIETYNANFIPQGSFAYDTLDNQSPYSDDSYYIYQSHQNEAFRIEYNSFFDQRVSGIPGAVVTIAEEYSLVYETPPIGDGQFLYSISHIEISAIGDDGEYYRAYVIDEDGDTLQTDSATTDTRSYPAFKMGIGNNIGRFLSVRIVPADDNRTFMIHDVTVYYKRLGRVRIE